MNRVANWFAAAWVFAVAVYFLLAPVYASSTSIADWGRGAPAAGQASSGRATLLSVNGPGAAVAVLVPVVLAALPLLARTPKGRRTLSAFAAVLLGLFVVLGAASVGLFYAPAAVALGLAAAGPGGERPRPAT